jgi:nucleotide-binding universal stress UspA family protein
MIATRKILVPTDFSAHADRAFQLACSLARDAGAHVVVLHVVPLPAVIYGPPPESYLDHLQEELKQIQARDPKICVEHVLVEGNAATAIVRVARELNCDMIVIGTHGRTGVSRLLMGSIAEEVVRKALCPVVAVKIPASSAHDGAELAGSGNRGTTAGDLQGCT